MIICSIIIIIHWNYALFRIDSLICFYTLLLKFYMYQNMINTSLILKNPLFQHILMLVMDYYLSIRSLELCVRKGKNQGSLKVQLIFFWN